MSAGAPGEPGRRQGFTMSEHLEPFAHGRGSPKTPGTWPNAFAALCRGLSARASAAHPQPGTRFGRRRAGGVRQDTPSLFFHPPCVHSFRKVVRLGASSVLAHSPSAAAERRPGHLEGDSVTREHGCSSARWKAKQSEHDVIGSQVLRPEPVGFFLGQRQCSLQDSRRIGRE